MTVRSLPTIFRRWRLFAAVAVTVTAVGGGGILLAVNNSDPSTALAFHSVSTVRVLDFRPDSQVGSRNTPLGASGTFDLLIPGLPDDVKAVNVNVTVVDGTAPSFLTVYPKGDTRPTTSTINWNAAAAVANNANVSIKADHTLTLYNLTGTVNVVVDLLGYYSPSPVGSGPAGPVGAVGPQGAVGPAGTDATISSGNWGVILRNTIGSPSIDLRSGPNVAGTGPLVKPPYGTGSLQFLVGIGNDPLDSEKAAYGNEVDFAGDLVSGLTAVGYNVFTTGENSGRNAAGNMPGITFEIDPNLTATPSNYASLVFQPSANSTAGQWSGYIDATSGTAGLWWLTGAAGTATGCNQVTLCTFSQVQTALGGTNGTGAVISTVSITKGRDYAWQGAIDGLRINNQIFDFEASGVQTVVAP